MKKIICLSLVILSTAATAFAATDLATHTATTTAAAAIRGGADQGTANAAPTPLIQLSTGVHALVNFSEIASGSKTSAGYVIAARHATGSKNFATSNALPNVYWKQASKVISTNSVTTALAAEVDSSDNAATVFAAGNGWTSY